MPVIRKITAYQTSDKAVFTDEPAAQKWQAELDLIVECERLMQHVASAKALADALSGRADTMRKLLLPLSSDAGTTKESSCD